MAPSPSKNEMLTVGNVETWLTAYGAAWENRDADAAAPLFAANARYYQTPYEEPFAGPDGIRAYWARVTEDQKDIDFTFDVIAVTGQTGIARWHARFALRSNGANVELDGVFVLEFDASGRCTTLREWWHAR